MYSYYPLTPTHIRILFPGKRPASSDTATRDKLDEIMNTITRKYYGFILVTCPECWTITPRHDDEPKDCENQNCSMVFRASDAPDLFF